MKIRRYRKYLLEVHGIQKDFFLDALTSMFEKNSGKTLRYLMVFFRVGSIKVSEDTGEVQGR